MSADSTHLENTVIDRRTDPNVISLIASMPWSSTARIVGEDGEAVIV